MLAKYNSVITNKKMVKKMAEKKAMKKFQMVMEIDTYEKLKYISDLDERSVVKQINYWVKQQIEKYESNKGKISMPNVVQKNKSGDNNFNYNEK